MFEPRVSSTPPISERPSRVLVVSPDAAHQAELERLLEHDGYEVLKLADVDELLRVVAEFEPDVVLLDAHQHSASSVELCGELSALDPKRLLPVLVVSWGGATEGEVVAGLMSGAHDFIRDPSAVLELSARLRAQLRVKRLVDALHRVRNERDILRRDAECDALTGLLNRRALERAAQARVDKRERFGVLFVDGDRFKLINDGYGHLVGDRVLISIAEMLRAGLRPGDAVGRYGGEEFVAIVAGAGPESARLVAERLRKSIEALPPPKPGPERITVSIGTAVFDPRSGEGVESVFRRADLALYAAKRAGRNRVVMHTPECEEALSPAQSSARPSAAIPRAEEAGR